jgi:hypothetical protein
LKAVEQAFENIDIRPGGRRRAADEIEYLAVLHAVGRDPLDPPVLVEINRHHALVGDAGGHERHRPFGALRDIIERFAADGRDGRGRAEHDQHLFLRRAERDLLERSVGQDVAALEGFAETAAERKGKRKHHGQRRCRLPASVMH